MRKLLNDNETDRSRSSSLQEISVKHMEDLNEKPGTSQQLEENTAGTLQDGGINRNVLRRTIIE